MHYCGILKIHVQQHEVCLSNDALKNLFAYSDHHRCKESHSLIFFSILNPVILYSDHWFFFLHILSPTHARKVKTKCFINICFEKVSVMIFLDVYQLKSKISSLFVNEIFSLDRRKCFDQSFEDNAPMARFFNGNNKRNREQILQH